MSLYARAEVTRAIFREIGVRTETEETRFDSLGIDSLEFLSIVVAIEEETGVAIPPGLRLASIETVGDLIELVDKTLSELTVLQ